MPVTDKNGQIYRLAGVAMDITARKQAEAALQLAHSNLAYMSRLKTAGELAASIAHEVNHPIAGIVSHSEAGLRWLGHRPPNLGEVQEALHHVIQDANRAANVIRGIRSFLQKAPTPFVKLDLNELIRSVLSLVEGELRNAEVGVQTRLLPGLPAVSGV